MRFHNCVERLLINHDPRTSATRGSSLSALVFYQSNLGVHSRPEIEAFVALALKDINGGHIENLVDLVGIEPTTSSMPWKRAPSCATGPRFAEQLFYCGGSRPGQSQTRGALRREIERPRARFSQAAPGPAPSCARGPRLARQSSIVAACGPVRQTLGYSNGAARRNTKRRSPTPIRAGMAPLR